jgi:pentapeptide MXKDX repeat protein
MECIHADEEKVEMITLRQAATLMFLSVGGPLVAVGTVHAQDAMTKSNPMKTDAMKADAMHVDTMKADAMKKRTVKAGASKNDAMKKDAMAPKTH